MAAGDPTGADLTSGTTDGNTLPQVGSWEEREITFGAGIELTSGTKYAIVVRAPDAVAFDDVHWIGVTPGGAAGGNSLTSDDSGSSWTPSATRDNWFKTKATAVEKDTYTPAAEGSFNTLSATEWVAQSFTASSTYTITSVILKMQRFTGISPGTVTVSIKATEPALPGKTTTPVPANTTIDVRRNLLTTGWAAGADTDSFDVYFGLQGNPILQESGYVPTSWTIGGVLLYNTIYEWRVDSNNIAGTTTGDTWLFTILIFNPPLPSGVTLAGNSGPNGEGTPTGTPTGFNNVITVKRLVAAAENKIWFEDL